MFSRIFYQQQGLHYIIAKKTSKTKKCYLKSWDPNCGVKGFQLHGIEEGFPILDLQVRGNFWLKLVTEIGGGNG